MKKIMIFIGGYLPGQKYGGPVTSISNFSDLLGDMFDIRIVCSNHDLGDTSLYPDISNGWNKVGKSKVLYLNDSEQRYSTFLKIMDKERPDLIYGSGIMYFKVNSQMIKAARKLDIPVLLAPRGDICENALRIKAWKKLPFLKILKITKYYRNIKFHATMQEEIDNAHKYLGVENKNTYLLPNIPTQPVHKETMEKRSGGIKLVFISRIQEKKNLLKAIEIVNKVKSSVIFDIYGPLENKEYWEKCQLQMKMSPSNVHITYKGALSPAEAKNVYLNYDAFLFPTFSENYGHVIAEALLHDCPIIISKGTTPWDDVNQFDAGIAVEQDDDEKFVKYIEKIANMKTDEYEAVVNNVRLYAREKIKLDQLKTDYIQMLESCFRV